MSSVNAVPRIARLRAARSPRLPRLQRGLLNAVTYLLSFLALLLVWEAASVYLVHSVLFPPPTIVLSRFVTMLGDGSLVDNTVSSLIRIAIGFALGCVCGVPVGLLVGSSPLVRRVVEPWTEFLRFIPAVSMTTTAIIWFGIGEQSKIFLITYTTIFIIVLNTTAGVGAIAPNKLWAARALGASSGQVFCLVTLPASMPFILTGMRLAMANSFTTVVVAEMVAAKSGLGVMIWNARLFMMVDQMFVAQLTLGLLGLAADRIFRLAILRFAGRFAPVM